MGSGTPAELKSKRIYSLAYHRATAALKEKHEEEFQRLLRAHISNIRLEDTLTGTVESERGGVRHRPDETGDKCEWCGRKAPCPAMRQRRRKAEADGRSWDEEGERSPLVLGDTSSTPSAEPASAGEREEATSTSDQQG